MNYQNQYFKFIFLLMKWFGGIFALLGLIFTVIVYVNNFMKMTNLYPDYAINLSLAFVFWGWIVWFLASFILRKLAK